MVGYFYKIYAGQQKANVFFVGFGYKYTLDASTDSTAEGFTIVSGPLWYTKL